MQKGRAAIPIVLSIARARLLLLTVAESHTNIGENTIAYFEDIA